MIENKKMPIGMNAKTKNNCKASLFIVYIEPNFGRCVKYPNNFQAILVMSKLFLEQT